MGSSKPEKEKNSKKSGSGSESGSGDEGEAPNASAAPGGLLSRFTQRFTSRNKPESKAAEPVVDYLEEEPEMYVDRDGADSDTNAEAATLFARRPLVRPCGVCSPVCAISTSRAVCLPRAVVGGRRGAERPARSPHDPALRAGTSREPRVCTHIRT
jgi:hypothetical protein